MVYVPAATPVVVPGHTLGELALKMAPKIGQRVAYDILPPVAALAGSRGPKAVADCPSHPIAQPLGRVALAICGHAVMQAALACGCQAVRVLLAICCRHTVEEVGCRWLGLATGRADANPVGVHKPRLCRRQPLRISLPGPVPGPRFSLCRSVAFDTLPPQEMWHIRSCLELLDRLGITAPRADLEKGRYASVSHCPPRYPAGSWSGRVGGVGSSYLAASILRENLLLCEHLTRHWPGFRRLLLAQAASSDWSGSSRPRCPSRPDPRPASPLAGTSKGGGHRHPTQPYSIPPGP